MMLRPAVPPIDGCYGWNRITWAHVKRGVDKSVSNLRFSSGGCFCACSSSGLRFNVVAYIFFITVCSCHSQWSAQHKKEEDLIDLSNSGWDWPYLTINIHLGLKLPRTRWCCVCPWKVISLQFKTFSKVQDWITVPETTHGSQDSYSWLFT